MADGKQLHDEACLHCHASLTKGNANQIYSRADRKVKNLVDLEKRVKYCAIAADVDWTQQQQDAVVTYLRQQFYKF